MVDKNQCFASYYNHSTGTLHTKLVVPQPPVDPPFVADGDWLDDCLGWIQVGLARDDTDVLRVPPLAVVRCSRGGKTRALTEIAHALSNEDIATIFVSFNGLTSFESDEEPIKGLCRRIAFAASHTGSFDFTLWASRGWLKNNVSVAQIEEWLTKFEGQKLVLVIDELNKIQGTEYLELARFLKKHFLIPKGRYLVFSSHVVSSSNISTYMDADLDAEGLEKNL